MGGSFDVSMDGLWVSGNVPLVSYPSSRASQHFLLDVSKSRMIVVIFQVSTKDGVLLL